MHITGRCFRQMGVLALWRVRGYIEKNGVKDGSKIEIDKNGQQKASILQNCGCNR